MTFTSLGREDTNPLALNYTYTSPSLGHLSITGTTTVVSISNDGGVTHSNHYGNYDLEAVIDPTHGTATSGSISIQTYVSGFSGPMQTVLSSTNLVAFGNASSFSEIDFKFIQSGSSILSGIQNNTVFGLEVFQLSQYSPVSPSWLANFSDATVKNDGGAAPMPKTAHAGIGLLGLVAFGAMARRKRVIA